MDGTEDQEIRQIVTLLDTFIPGDGRRWPAAAELGLTAAFLAEIDREPGRMTLDAFLRALPHDFQMLDQNEREAIVGRQPKPVVEALAGAAYRAYYTSADIAERIVVLSRQA